MTSSGRTRTVWMLVAWMSVLSLVVIAFKLYPMNEKWGRVQSRSSQVEFGTDEDLESVIGFLETRLEERGEYIFSIENTPMRITNVLFLTDGSGRRLRRDKNAIRVSMIYQSENRFYTQLSYRGKSFTASPGDTFDELGHVIWIDQPQVIVKNEGKPMSYPAPGSEETTPKELKDFVVPGQQPGSKDESKINS